MWPFPNTPGTLCWGGCWCHHHTFYVENIYEFYLVDLRCVCSWHPERDYPALIAYAISYVRLWASHRWWNRQCIIGNDHHHLHHERRTCPHRWCNPQCWEGRMQGRADAAEHFRLGISPVFHRLFFLLIITNTKQLHNLIKMLSSAKPAKSDLCQLWSNQPKTRVSVIMVGQGCLAPHLMMMMMRMMMMMTTMTMMMMVIKVGQRCLAPHLRLSIRIVMMPQILKLTLTLVSLMAVEVMF